MRAERASDLAQWETLLPGFRERADRFNTIIREVVARLNDPEVIVIEAGAEIDRLSPVVSTVDGLHYTPAGHAAIATVLDVAVSRWLASRADSTASPIVGEETQGPLRPAAPRRGTRSG